MACSALFIFICSCSICFAREEVASWSSCDFFTDFIEARKFGCILFERVEACRLCCMLAKSSLLVLKAGKEAGRDVEASSHGRVRNVAAIVVREEGEEPRGWRASGLRSVVARSTSRSGEGMN